VLRVLRESDVEVLDIRLGELELHASKVADDHHLNGRGRPRRAPWRTRGWYPGAGRRTRQLVEVPENTARSLCLLSRGRCQLVEISAPDPRVLHGIRTRRRSLRHRGEHGAGRHHRWADRG